MAWPQTYNRLCLAYDNHINRSEVYGTPTFDNMTALTGYGALNLTYDDPSVYFKGTPTNTALDVAVKFALSVSTACSVVGVANHNLYSQGYDRLALAWSNDGSAWTDIHSWASIVPPSGYGNPNFFLRFTPTTAHDYWRITFGRSSGTRAAITVGMIFLGSFYEVPVNPVNGQIFHRQKPSLEIVRGGGGAAFANPNLGRRIESGSLHFRRIGQTQAAVFSEILCGRNSGKVVGLIHPEAASYLVAPGIQHAFCYVTPTEYGAQSGYASDNHKYDVSLDWEGAC